MRWLLHSFLWLALLAVLGTVGAGVFVYQWVHKPLDLQTPTIDLRISSGSGLHQIARQLVSAGVDMPPQAFVWLARLTEMDRDIKAGGYRITQGDSLMAVLQRMARGEVSHRQVAFIEGWTVKQIMQAVAKHPDIDQTLSDQELSDQKALASRLGVEHQHLEGLLFPDTYVFAVGTSDEEILKRALAAQEEILSHAWRERAPDLPLKTPHEALILASIVEKETGRADERARVAGVFINRLRIGMPLQTDPTVIYGMGDLYQGRIRKADLQRDTPWNTYTRRGLPTTPIASSSLASLQAALNPETHAYLYFVARGDGSSAFAKNLADHNSNVRRYILKKP
uniref:endolytic transglycosylase MltG n=1 Tax=Orrella sp. TaxID=1921583 RepID=UPI00405579F7